MKKYTASVEAPDDWEPKFGKYSVDFFFDRDIISTEMIEVEELPKEAQDYVLFIEKAVGSKIKYVSVGAGRDEYFEM